MIVAREPLSAREGSTFDLWKRATCTTFPGRFMFT
jgi:hypothetical protein